MILVCPDNGWERRTPVVFWNAVLKQDTLLKWKYVKPCRVAASFSISPDTRPKGVFFLMAAQDIPQSPTTPTTPPTTATKRNNTTYLNNLTNSITTALFYNCAGFSHRLCRLPMVLLSGDRAQRRPTGDRCWSRSGTRALLLRMRETATAQADVEGRPGGLEASKRCFSFAMGNC